MICKNCGKALDDTAQFCDNCGTSTSTDNKSTKIKCLPSFILGLVGSIFGMFGGICTSMCLALSVKADSALLFIFGGSVIGLVGACLCLSKARIGSILELISALMIAYCGLFLTGSDIMGVIAMLMLFAGGIIGVVYSFIIKKK